MFGNPGKQKPYQQCSCRSDASAREHLGGQKIWEPLMNESMMMNHRVSKIYTCKICQISNSTINQNTWLFLCVYQLRFWHTLFTFGNITCPRHRPMDKSGSSIGKNPCRGRCRSLIGSSAGTAVNLLQIAYRQIEGY